MFEDASPETLVGVIEETQREESKQIARRMAAIGTLLWLRTREAEDAPLNPDPGFAIITGFARTCAEVSAAMNVTSMAAKDTVAAAEALDTRLPEVAKLLAEGKTDWSTVAVIISRTELVDWGLMAKIDASLAGRIAGWQCWSRKRITNAVDAAVRTVDPEAAKERRVNADTERRISFVAEPNGMARARGRLSAPAAAVVDKRLSEMAKSVCAQDTRTLAQRRIDALVAICEGHGLACDCGREDCPARDTDEPPAAPRFVINVIASQETLTGTSEQPGHLEGYGVIDAEQIRTLAETAALRLVSEPTVTEEQAVNYQPSAAVERWVRVRGLTCSFPGCDRPAWTADIDHSVPFNHTTPGAGGKTVPDNLDPKCREHHRLKTFHDGPGGWRTRQHPDGTVEWTSPTGRVYRSAPEGADLFPQLRPACAKPAPRKQNRRTDTWARSEEARHTLDKLRLANAEQRRINDARALEIDRRQWRNNMRQTLLHLKGGKPSTSPFCSWANDPPEDPHITADWKPPPRATAPPDDDKPPF